MFQTQFKLYYCIKVNTGTNFANMPQGKNSTYVVLMRIAVEH